MLATTKVRELLRVAIAERDQATEVEANAARAVVRAKALVDDAEQALAVLAGVEDEISTHRAGAVKAWATNGGERPSGDLPPHLASKEAAKADAETKLTEARSTHELLKTELVAAAGRLQGRNAAVQRAAGAVLSAEAEPIIDQLRQARRLVWSLEDKLKSLSTVRVAEADGRSVLIKMPAATFAAINETAPPMLAGNVPKPYEIAQARWNKYLQALTQDPNSTLD
jgi:hypothetical protein